MNGELFNVDQVTKVFGIETSDIIDIYGFTEQMGLNYPDCSAGWKHVPGCLALSVASNRARTLHGLSIRFLVHQRRQHARARRGHAPFARDHRHGHPGRHRVGHAAGDDAPVGHQAAAGVRAVIERMVGCQE